MEKKEKKRRVKKFENRVYAFIAAAFVIGFLVAFGSMISVVLDMTAEQEEKESREEQKPYEVQHAKLPVTLKNLGFEGTGEESTVSTEASGSKAATIYQYSDIFYQEDGSYTNYCQYGVYVCDNGIWADQFLEKKEAAEKLSEEQCGVWRADSGMRITDGDEKGRLYLRYGDHLLYWQSGYELSQEQVDRFLTELKMYLEQRPEL